MHSSPEGLEDHFYKNLEFGIVARIGLMDIEDNRINKYTLEKSTQVLSNYLHQSFPNQSIKAVIAYDCLHDSASLAKAAQNPKLNFTSACILA